MNSITLQHIQQALEHASFRPMHSDNPMLTSEFTPEAFENGEIWATYLYNFMKEAQLEIDSLSLLIRYSIMVNIEFHLDAAGQLDWDVALFNPQHAAYDAVLVYAEGSDIDVVDQGQSVIEFRDGNHWHFLEDDVLSTMTFTEQDLGHIEKCVDELVYQSGPDLIIAKMQGAILCNMYYLGSLHDLDQYCIKLINNLVSLEDEDNDLRLRLIYIVEAKHDLADFEQYQQAIRQQIQLQQQYRSLPCHEVNLMLDVLEYAERYRCPGLHEQRHEQQME